MFASVVIPTYNRKPILEKCLEALEAQDLGGVLERYEVVVIDDGSTDGTPEWLRSEAQRFPHVRLFEQDHGGPAEGRNNGVRRALGDVIVFIDSDLVVTPTKAKQLTNVRASGTDEAVILTPPVLHSLEQALEFIDEDELVEVTPDSIRLRKKLLLEHERKRASRNAA